MLQVTYFNLEIVYLQCIIKKGILVDYWDSPLIYQSSSKTIEVFSSGKNKIPNDSDDIQIK